MSSSSESDNESAGDGVENEELLSINGDSEPDPGTTSSNKNQVRRKKDPSTDSENESESAGGGVENEELLSINGDSEAEPGTTSASKSKNGETRNGISYCSDSDISSEKDEDELLSINGDEIESGEGIHPLPSTSKTQLIVTENGTKQTSGETNADDEITLSDDDDESGNVRVPSTSSSTVNSTSPPRYGLRMKRTVNYAEINNCTGLADDDDEIHQATKKSKKDIFDIFSLPNSKIDRIMRDPSLIDVHTVCKICFMDGTDSAKLAKVTKFFEKCGQQFEHIFISTRKSDEVYAFIKGVFKTTKILGRIDYRYHDRDDAYEIIKLIKDLTSCNHLPNLRSLKLLSNSGSVSLTETHLALIADIPCQFHSLELGDSLWEDVKTETIEKLLKKLSASLDKLIIHGGFRGSSEKDRKLITFPKMDALKTLCICPVYGFVSEIKNPHSKKQRVISLNLEQEEPFKVAVKFPRDHLPNLERLVLGNLIEIEDLQFSTIRKLTEFRCGSYWNLAISFPSATSRKSLLESLVTELQLPDALKDPYFPVQIAKHFPNVKKIYFNLPSVPVLRAFFKAFENSKLEALYLKTQYDFDSTLESCLLPNMSDVLKTTSGTETILRTLKEYKHFDEYVKYYNIELPVEQDDLMESHSAGIASLKNLKILHLEHIPRKLLIPIPDDERKWYDHHCKFMSTTFGYIHYPLKQRCHKEILKLDLNEYIWKNIQISAEYTDEFHQAGFVDISEEQIIDMEAQYHNLSYVEGEEEDIFIPIQRKQMESGTHVKIMPSMLAPVFKSKTEGA